MDVRCERCKTEYEFDDTRITEAGVTVKCTTCGHVFKVKKKALVVTVPVNPEDAPRMQVQEAASIAAPSPSGEKAPPREWKVRQSNGNVFTFKELTTLQKWIVERKVAREDEISLTGESWKRLGNIAELASFFQVVEEAQKSQQLQALQSAAAMGLLPPAVTPAGGYIIPSGDAAAGQLGGVPLPPGLRPAVPAIPAVPAVMVAPQGYAAVQAVPQPQPVGSPPPAAVATQAAPIPAAAPPSPPPPAPAPSSAPAAASASAPTLPAVAAANEEDLEAAKVKRGGAGRVVLVLLVLAVLGGGGYFGYFSYWLPQQEAKRAAEEEARARAERERREAEERAAAQKVAEEEAARAAEAAAAAAAAAAEVAAAAAAADAGTPAEGEGDVAAAPGKRVVRDFDYWMSQGDKLREREKPAAALDAYGRAADMQPDRAEPHAGRGLALLDMGNKLQAEGLFLQALKLNPRYGVAIMGLAETYRSLGNKEEAVKYYERYLDVLPSGPEAPAARTALKRLQE
jgi:predicted Zn finger-like uncharacterized protein